MMHKWSFWAITHWDWDMIRTFAGQQWEPAREWKKISIKGITTNVSHISGSQNSTSTIPHIFGDPEDTYLKAAWRWLFVVDITMVRKHFGEINFRKNGTQLFNSLRCSCQPTWTSSPLVITLKCTFVKNVKYGLLPID